MAIKLNDHMHVEVYLKLINSFGLLGKYELALEYATTLIKNNPYEKDAYSIRADIYSTMG